MSELSRAKTSFDRVLEAVAAAGLRYELSRGTHIQAECPTHDDNHPSLSIDYFPAEGRVKLNCHASCDVMDIVAALDLTYPMIYDDYLPPDEFAEKRARDREEGRPRPRQRSKPKVGERKRPALPKGRLPKRVTVIEPRPLGEWRVAATYDYTDEVGVVIHQEVRHQRQVEFVDEQGTAREKTEKRFTQRWPDGRGGWLEKTPRGFVPVLYRLPDVGEWVNNGQRIWLCEGAKDAERFLDLGEAATTNPSGAGNFKASQGEALAGAHVIVVLDHDLAGYRRGIKLAELIADAGSLRFALPVTQGRHEDASDHFDAGHGLEDFTEVSLEQLRRLEQVAIAGEAALAASVAVDEARARVERAGATTGASKAADERRFAARWATEAGKHLVVACGALDEAWRVGLSDDQETLDRLVAAVRAAQASALDAHTVAGVKVPDELREYLEEPSGRVGDLEEQAADELDNVVELPTASQLPPPSHRLRNMERIALAYETGGPGLRPRGVYAASGRDESGWELIAPLPFVHARVKQRDGSGKPTGTFYLVSKSPDSEVVMIGHEEIRSHSWTNLLGLPIDQHDKTLRAATTALLFHAEDVEEREATPRMDDGGKIAVPYEMPIGYLTASDLPRDQALGVWREIAGLVAQSPRLALVLGASAIAPFIAGLGQQPHVVSMYGKAKSGKTTGLTAVSSLWGFPGGATDSGVRLSWNATSLSVPAFLGSIAVLPAFMDEIGQAGDMKDSQWHQLISNITQGAVRMTRAPRKPGVQLGLTWRGIFFSTGNGTMGTGAVGRNAGIPRRMVELEAPFTNSKEHGQAIERLVPKAYGHVGLEIIERHSLGTVRPLVARAQELLGGDFETSHEDAMAEHLAAHLAGALMLDELLGTGGVLSDAALIAAGEFLDECAPPISDADQVLEEISSWIAREPGAWPTREQYDALMRPKSIEGDQALPAHGFRSEFAGYRDGGTVYVTARGAWQDMVARLDIEPKVALRDLWDQGLLQVTQSRRRRGEWSVQNRLLGCTVYAITLPPDEDPQAENDALIGPVGGGVGGNDKSVGGGVGGDNVPLTCGVGGVGGVGGNSSRTYARTRDIPFTGSETSETDPPTAPDPEVGEVVTKLEEPVACQVCGEPTGYSLNGLAVHSGTCAEQTLAGDPQTAGPAAEQSAAPTVDEPKDGPAERERAEAGHRPKVEERRPPRFTAPAVCLDGEGVHLADGTVRPWPQVAHLGDLAALTGRDQLRLGWGGGEDRLPDQGQIWLYPDALERLGLPTEPPALPDKTLSKAQRAKATAKAYAKLDDHPVVAGALEAGWQLGQGGHLDVWTRIWHRDLLPQGAMIVGLPWHRIEGVALFEDHPEPGELARRLLVFAQQVGVTYRISTAATGLDLIDHHRPPRRHVDDDIGAGRGRVALQRGVGAELPPWRSKTRDARFTTLEQDFSWWRPWEQLTASEQTRRYVHGYDRNASYLVPWRSIELGAEDLIHRTGDDAAWDGKEHPGYYLVDAGWEWPHWGLPDPGTAAGARVSNGRAWVTVHTLKQLKAHGVTPRVHESYTWGATSRYLEGPGTALSQARTALMGARGRDTAADAVLATVKALYAGTVGKLAEINHSPDFHLWRPDWRDHVISATRTAILHTITKAQEISGEHPLVVDRDAVFYASDDPDPVTAWPGDPAKLGTALGSWKPIGTTELDPWGTTWLPARRAGVRWPYADAVDALRNGGDQ